MQLDNQSQMVSVIHSWDVDIIDWANIQREIMPNEFDIIFWEGDQLCRAVDGVEMDFPKPLTRSHMGEL